MEFSSLTRDPTLAPFIESEESYPLDHQGSPLNLYFNPTFSTQFYPKIKYFMLHILFITLPYFSATHTHTHTYASVFKYWGFPGSSVVKNPSANAGDIRDAGSTPGPGRSLEEEMATHSNILARKIPQMEETGRLQSMGWQRVKHNWSDLAHMHACAFYRILGTSSLSLMQGSQLRFLGQIQQANLRVKDSERSFMWQEIISVRYLQKYVEPEICFFFFF